MQTENKQPLPLYKVLDKERTPGKWEIQAAKPNPQFGNQLYYGILSDAPKIIKGRYGSPGFYYPHSVLTEKEREANAAFTVLAVNNLSALAEALETIKNVLTDWNGEGKYQGLINHAKTALSRIS